MWKILSIHDEPEPLCDRALKITERSLGVGHPDVANVLNRRSIDGGKGRKSYSVFISVYGLPKLFEKHSHDNPPLPPFHFPNVIETPWTGKRRRGRTTLEEILGHRDRCTRRTSPRHQSHGEYASWCGSARTASWKWGYGGKHDIPDFAPRQLHPKIMIHFVDPEKTILLWWTISFTFPAARVLVAVCW